MQSADRVVVMTKGAVVESGTQTELEAANGVYASLIRRQMRSPGGVFLPHTASAVSLSGSEPA